MSKFLIVVLAVALLDASPGFCNGFYYSGDGFTPLNVPGSNGNSTQPFDVNNAGVVVGSYVVGNVEYGFVDNRGSFTTLSAPGGNNIARGINDANQIVGGYLYAGGNFNTAVSGFSINDRGLIASNNGITDSRGNLLTSISVPGSTFTISLGINNRNQVVGWCIACTSGSTAENSFLYSNGIFTILAVPGATDTLALGLNDRDQIVGTYFDGGIFHGFLYGNGTYTTIDNPEGSNTRLSGINDRGQIVGWDEVPAVAPAVTPLPASWTTMFLGLAMLGLLAWRKQKLQAA